VPERIRVRWRLNALYPAAHAGIRSLDADRERFIMQRRSLHNRNERLGWRAAEVTKSPFRPETISSVNVLIDVQGA
jgi:hypothetical protein